MSTDTAKTRCRGSARASHGPSAGPGKPAGLLEAATTERARTTSRAQSRWSHLTPAASDTACFHFERTSDVAGITAVRRALERAIAGGKLSSPEGYGVEEPHGVSHWLRGA